MFLTWKSCCCCINLRQGSFIIGYLFFFMRVAVLMLTSIRQASNNAILHHSHEIGVGDLSFHRMTGVISLMILSFELLLTIALLYGLHKNLDQHLEMFYVGSFAFLVMSTILYSVVLLRYAALLGTMAWVVVAVEIIAKMINIYFLLVIRSYYFKMREEIADREQLDPKDASNQSYFARTKPVLVGSKA